MMIQKKQIADLPENVKEFLKNERKVFGVSFIHFGFGRDAHSYLRTLSIDQAKEIDPTANSGGFEVVLNKDFPFPKVLTELSHEVAHTYQFRSPENMEKEPECLFPQEYTNWLKVYGENKKWYSEIEGLAWELGRELLLPREEFVEYVKNNYPRVSVKNFAKMLRELGVSRDVLSQRLLRDLELWDACVFWGTVEGNKIKCRKRDRRKSRKMEWVSIEKGLYGDNPYLRDVIFEYKDESEIKGYTFHLRGRELKIDMRFRDIGNEKKDFIGIIYI